MATYSGACRGARDTQRRSREEDHSSTVLDSRIASYHDDMAPELDSENGIISIRIEFGGGASFFEEDFLAMMQTLTIWQLE